LLDNIFIQNQKWAETVTQNNADFFATRAKQQSPEILWIGCSDSRVPPTQITGLLPGDLFVHRNIANLLVHSDLSSLSVLQYAVEVLRVKHIVVCGHYGCGGVKASMGNESFGLIDNWLEHIKDISRLHQKNLDVCSNEEEKFNRLCELNVAEQVDNICRTSIVKQAWKSGQQVSVHGWIYELETGLLKDLKVTKKQ